MFRTSRPCTGAPFGPVTFTATFAFPGFPFLVTNSTSSFSAKDTNLCFGLCLIACAFFELKIVTKFCKNPVINENFL